MKNFSKANIYNQKYDQIQVGHLMLQNVSLQNIFKTETE